MKKHGFYQIQRHLVVAGVCFLFFDFVVLPFESVTKITQEDKFSKFSFFWSFLDHFEEITLLPGFFIF